MTTFEDLVAASPGAFEQCQAWNLGFWLNARNGVQDVQEQIRATPEISHYTTLAGLEGILRSNFFRAYASDTTNDHTETSYARSVLWSVCAEARNAKANCLVTRTMCDALIDIDKLLDTQRTQPFIASFSARDDDLDMWRGYGRGGISVELIFDTKELHERTLARMSPSLLFAPVVYTEKQQRYDFSLLINHYIDAVNQMHARNLGWSLHDLMGAMAGFMFHSAATLLAISKNPKFQAEHEWRMALVDGARSASVQDGFLRDRLSRYVELKHLPREAKLPLVGVRLGPQRRELSLTGVTSDICAFLESRGYDSKKLMRKSDCPLQL